MLCVARFVLLSLLFVAPVVAEAEKLDLPWPDRNGPTFDGRARSADIVGLPTHWDEATKQNLAWKIPLEGQGHSTPAIGKGRLWLTASSSDGKQNFVYCIDARSGKIIHHKLIFENEKPEPLGNPINTYASPSPLLEDDAVYVHFGSYGTARLNSETAEIVWQRRDFPCRHFRGPGSSPAIYENIMALTFDGIDQQYVAAVDKRTGATLWKTPRSTDYKDLNEKGLPKGDGDYRKAYNTPGFTKVGNGVQLVSIGSRAAFGYDAFTGREIWTIEHLNYNAAVQPLFLPGVALINTGSERGSLIALRLDDSTRGNVTTSHVIWERKKGNAAHASQVMIDGRIYLITNAGVASCVDAKSGEEIWTKRVGGNFSASPVVADKLIYFCDEKGTTTVIRAGAEYDEVAQNKLDEGMRASPAVAYGALYLRTYGYLYKIASPGR